MIENFNSGMMIPVIPTSSGGSSGGSDFPTVTEDDNGKVLGVVDGVWDKMDVPGGAVVIKQITVSEAVVSITDSFDKAYKHLTVCAYTPTAASNTTNNNALLFKPNSVAWWSFSIGGISIYGPIIQKSDIDCEPTGLFAFGVSGSVSAKASHSTDFASGIHSFTIVPNTSGDTDMIPAGTVITIYGRDSI